MDDEIALSSGDSEEEKSEKWAFRRVKQAIQSGRFDAPEMEHINAYWAREGLIKRQQEEVQRLREALGQIKLIIVEHDADGRVADMYEILEIAREALSASTTEPTGAERVRELWALNTEEGNRADEEYLAGIVDTLNALGYKIPGINAPEKGDNTP